MQAASVSAVQLARMHSALEHITPAASPNQLARTLEQIVGTMDELHAEGGPLADQCCKWLMTRRTIRDLPEIHDRAQQSAMNAQLAAAEIADLEKQLHTREMAQEEVAAIHADTMNTVRRESPLLIVIATLTAFSAIAFDFYWMLAITVLPSCLLLMMGSVAFRSRLLLARLHNGIRAAVTELEEAEALAAERASYEILLARSFENLRATLSGSLSRLTSPDGTMRVAL